MKNNSDKTELFNKTNYQIDDLDSEIKVDQLCSALLKRFHQYLLNDLQLDPLEAGSQAAGADYFLREFIIGGRRDNIFNCTAEQIKQFGGNWYIVKNLEPKMPELEIMLSGTASFFMFCAANELTSSENAEQISSACADLDFFRQRINDFHAITGAGFKAWDKACPL